MKKGYAAGLFLMVAVMAVALVPELALAQGLGTGNGGSGAGGTTILTGAMPMIKFGLGLYSAWKWFQYFAGFNPNTAFLDIIVPALMTFLSFKVDTVLGWFKVTG